MTYKNKTEIPSHKSPLLPDTKPQQQSQSTLSLQAETPKLPKCSYCHARRHVIHHGIRQTKRKHVQRYLCKKCNKSFSTEPLQRTSYPPEIIVSSITHYNLGNTIEKTRASINRKFKTKIPQPTIQSWLKRYSYICTFTNTLR